MGSDPFLSGNSMDKEKQKKLSDYELAVERTELSHERTGLSILRTDLAFNNSKLSIEQTHLSFLRTVVSLVGSAATVYKALPLLGVSEAFSTLLSLFLLVSAAYFFIKDCLTYPKLKKEIKDMERQKKEIIEKGIGLQIPEELVDD